MILERYTFMYSSGVFPPALRTVSTPLSTCCPLQQNQKRIGEDLSTFLVMTRSCIDTLPAPEPPPVWDVPVCVAPKLAESRSISLAWPASIDSPSTLSSFRYISMAMRSPCECAKPLHPSPVAREAVDDSAGTPS